MAEKTVADLDTQIAALKRERDIASLPAAKEIQAVLAAPAVAALVADLETLLAQQSAESVAFKQATIMVQVLRQGSNLIDVDIARIEALAAQG